MTYLVDANVLSEPTKAVPAPKVVAWLTAHEDQLAVDPIILGEISIGVLSLSRGRRRVGLEQWLKSVVQAIECVAWGAAICHRWAELVVALRKKGQPMPILDSMIAATAL